MTESPDSYREKRTPKNSLWLSWLRVEENKPQSHSGHRENTEKRFIRDPHPLIRRSKAEAERRPAAEKCQVFTEQRPSPTNPPQQREGRKTADRNKLQAGRIPAESRKKEKRIE